MSMYGDADIEIERVTEEGADGDNTTKTTHVYLPMRSTIKTVAKVEVVLLTLNAKVKVVLLTLIRAPRWRLCFNP